MCDLQVLAYQADLTRVITFMIGREFSGVTYPQIGVPDAHHPITHHQQEPEKIAKVAKINAYHVTQFAYLLERLRATPDGDGSLLDHSTLIYGTGMGDCNAHDPRNIPLLLAGGGAGQLKGGRHIRYPEGNAARQPAPDAARQARRAPGADRRQHREDRRIVCCRRSEHRASGCASLAARVLASCWPRPQRVASRRGARGDDADAGRRVAQGARGRQRARSRTAPRRCIGPRITTIWRCAIMLMRGGRASRRRGRHRRDAAVSGVHEPQQRDGRRCCSTRAPIRTPRC